MTLYSKVGGALKQVSSLPVMINGEIKDISTLYSKKDGALVTVFSSGALIEFLDYPYAIPVAKGWQYSTDGKTWATVEEDGELNVVEQSFDFSGVNTEVYSSGGADNNFIYLSNLPDLSRVIDDSLSILIDYKVDTIRNTKGVIVLTSFPNVKVPISEFVEDSSGRFSIAVYLGDDSYYIDTDPEVVMDIAVVDSVGNKITSTEALNPFTGYVKVKDKLSLSEYYNDTRIGTNIVEYGARMMGTPLTHYASPYAYFIIDSTIFFMNSGTAYMYDMNGNMTTTDAPSVTTSFVIGSKGYTWYDGGITIWDSSGNMTSGNTSATSRNGVMTFVNNAKGYVCGGYTYSNSISSTDPHYQNVDVYDSSGNRTTGKTLQEARGSGSTFVNANKGYVCGGKYSAGTSTSLGYKVGDFATNSVDIYDSTGTRTTGTSLSSLVYCSATFVNANKGYVCGGYDHDWTGSTYGWQYMPKSTVNVYDSNSNRTTGASLSVIRAGASTFVLNSRGFVCGGLGGSQYGTTAQSVVDVYDSSGNRSTGNPLSAAAGNSPTLVIDSKAYVCDIDSDHNVDIYYDRYETLYSANIPVTEGSTYTLNGESGTADVSEILEFNTKVTGTIRYKSGNFQSSLDLSVVDDAGVMVDSATITIEDISNHLTVAVVDADGNVVEGAEITLLGNDWDLSGMNITWSEYSAENSQYTYTISGITGSFPKVAMIKFDGINDGATGDPISYTISDNNPNVSDTVHTFDVEYTTFTYSLILYDSDGNVIKQSDSITSPLP